MNIANDSVIFSEVYSILNMLGEKYIEKLPKNLYKLILDSKSNSYNPVFISLNDINTSNFHKEAMSIICLLYLNYWCESEKEKNELKEIFKRNQIKKENEIREKYNPDNLFKAKKRIDEVDNDKRILKETLIEESTALIEIKHNIFSKILLKIKKILFKK